MVVWDMQRQAAFVLCGEICVSVTAKKKKKKLLDQKKKKNTKAEISSRNMEIFVKSSTFI